MKNRRRLIGIVLATILALVGTISLVGYVRTAKDDAVAQQELVDVYVIDELVPKGADPDTIKASVKVEQVPARLRQDGAITDLDDIGENVAAADLQPGDQLLDARLAARDQVTEEVSDKVQISALLEAERAVGGSLKNGDLVGVYLSFDPFELDEAGQTQEVEVDAGNGAGAEVALIEGSADDDATEPASETGNASANDRPKKTPNVSRLELQNVLVTNVQTINAPVSTADDSEGETSIVQVTGTQYVVTLAMSPEQSERFVFATEFGHVWLSLQPATVADDGTRIVNLGNVYTVVK